MVLNRRLYIWTGVVLFLLIFCIRGVWLYEGTIDAKDEAIEQATQRRERAEDREQVQRTLTEGIRQDSLRRDLLAQEAIANLRVELGRQQANIRELISASNQLQTTILAEPEIIESASSDDLALSIPPKVVEAYPNYSFASIEWIPEFNSFEINRMMGNAILLSLTEVLNLRLQKDNLNEQIDLFNGRETSLNSIISQQEIRIDAWTVRAESAEDLNAVSLSLVETLEEERDTWEDKSKSQGRQLFFYKWGTRIGLAAGIAAGVIVATR